MFGNILGREKDELPTGDSTHNELTAKISKMNLPEMRAYVNNRAFEFEICEDGLVEVLKKLTTLNEDTEQRYIAIDDMDSKIKKGFDLIITISESKKITVVAVELIQEFIDVYVDIIEKFDTDNKQIYSSKLHDALNKAVNNVNSISEMNQKMKVLGS